ncbi:MAG: hypothetical protein LBE56_08340 [Tannerella sp.]|jgi:lantibiotic modifying enzyme|nr:hypothetical protein [Tannerella sp.]
MKEIVSRVVEIAECIYKEMKSKPYSAYGGLYSGSFGALLFLYYYADFTEEKKYSLLAEYVLVKLLNQLESNFPGFSYANVKYS